ncbi:MAG: FeoB-associated Cys-rich membrane protein [Reichenbachiella sp.]
MIQLVILILLFIGASAYIGRKIYRDLSAKEECSKGCASCDISKESVS